MCWWVWEVLLLGRDGVKECGGVVLFVVLIGVLYCFCLGYLGLWCCREG